MNPFIKGVYLVVLSALGFSLMPIFAVFSYNNGVSVSTLLFFRFAIAAVLFFTYVLFKFRKIIISKKELLSLLLLGGVCYTLQSTFYFSSVKYISPSFAVLLLYTYPMIVALLSFVFNKEVLTKRMIFSMLISFVGLVFIVGTSLGNNNALGIILALSASLIYSIYIVYGNKVVKNTPPLIMSSFISLFSSIGILSLGLATHDIHFHFATVAWIPIIGTSLVSTIMALFAFFRGIDLIGATKASVLSMTEPIFTVVFSILLLHDHLKGMQLFGGTVVLVGAVMVIWSREQPSLESRHCE